MLMTGCSSLTSFEGHVGDAVAVHRSARRRPVNHRRGVAHLREAESFRSAQGWKSARECEQKDGGEKKKCELINAPDRIQ